MNRVTIRKISFATSTYTQMDAVINTLKLARGTYDELR